MVDSPSQVEGGARARVRGGSLRSRVEAAGTFGPAALLMGGRLVGFAAAFAIPIALARIFTPAEFGTYKQLFLVAGTLYCLGQFGLAESLLYFLPLDPRRAPRYAFNSLLALIVGGAACLILVVAFREEIAGWLGNPDLAHYTTLLGTYLLLMLTSAGLENAMIARKRYGRAAATYVGLDLARAAFLLVPSLVARDLEWLLRGAVAFAALRCLMALWSLRAEFRGELAPSGPLLGRQLAYALPFQLAATVEIVQAKLHQYVVASHFDAATFAVYAVGCLDIPVAEFATSAVVNVLMVRMAEQRRNGREGAAVALWHEATRKLAMLFFPLAIGLMVTGQALIVTLFTEQYRASGPVFVVLSAALLLPALAVDGVLRVYAETRYLLGLNLVRLLLTASLISWFIADFGLVGAAAVTVIAAAVTRALGLARMSRVTGLPLTALLPWRSLGGILLAATAAAVPAAVVGWVLEASPLVSLGLAGATFGVAYLIALWAFGALSEDERAIVRGWLALRPAPAP